MKIEVKDNNIEQALRVLKRKLKNMYLYLRDKISPTQLYG